MTAVVLLGDVPSTGIFRDMPGPVTVPMPPDLSPGGADAFLDLAAGELAAEAAVVVLFPAWRSHTAARLIGLARGALRTDRIAGVPIDLPPLALALVADQLAFLAPHVTPGALTGAALRLPGRTIAGAWLRTVAGLEHVTAGVGAHVRSYLPQAAFVASVAPRRGVHRITPTAPAPEFGESPEPPVLVLATTENGDVHWPDRGLVPALGASSLTRLPAQPLSAEYWGTRKYVEFVAFSGHPQALPSTVKGIAYVTCAWCGELTASPRCAFCAMAGLVTDPSAADPPRRMAPAPPAEPPLSTGPPPVSPAPPRTPREHAPVDVLVGDLPPSALMRAQPLVPY
ncbi:hypothetical protein [Actinoallomurus iriomotensis]|uniref:Uncharacterized protein n=1 Tax=Actinoallomurus iriomotensis TaxID=478107 RepID=A0A9W6S1D3_9ACTN|nr:hypothetical protein [Actinoallomurus iriomotensis]GLY85319.1 hypothetical protein Airi02_032480 [Actinoallomurus iriomotensis]